MADKMIVTSNVIYSTTVEFSFMAFYSSEKIIKRPENHQNSHVRKPYTLLCLRVTFYKIVLIGQRDDVSYRDLMADTAVNTLSRSGHHLGFWGSATALKEWSISALATQKSTLPEQD